MQYHNEELFQSMPIPKAVGKMALPTIISMLVVVIYNMADTFFVGQTGDANQVAAVSLSMPVFLLMMAFGNMFGMGGSSYISRSLGEGKKERVKNISAFCFYGAIVAGIIILFIFLIAMNFILSLIGTSENTIDFARQYLLFIALGAPFVVLSNAFGSIIRSEGAAKTSMIGMMIGTFANIILDPIMILSMNMGVTGAAIATVIGNILSVLYYIFYLSSKKTILSFNPKYFVIKGVAKEVFAIGIPTTLSNILMSISNIIMNNFLSLYGDIAVAAMGVASKANMLVMMLQMGLAMGIQPLAGYCFGAGNIKRMKNIMYFAMFCNFMIGSILTVFYIFNAELIIKIFISDAGVIKNGIMMLKALMLAGPFIGVMFVFLFTFQAMGKAMSALILSLSRQGFVFIPILFLSNKLWGLNGIIFSQPIADIASLLMSLCMFSFVLKKLKKNNIVPSSEMKEI